MTNDLVVRETFEKWLDIYWGLFSRNDGSRSGLPYESMWAAWQEATKKERERLARLPVKETLIFLAGYAPSPSATDLINTANEFDLSILELRKRLKKAK